MRYRLPLELELIVLEFAAPPLAIDCLHDRVDFFITISLVHRSITAWAQDRLRDQFLYTYKLRSDEHERLKARFEAGFAGRDRPLRRLYLDLSDLPADIRNRTKPGTDSVSSTINGRVCGPIALASALCDTEGGAAYDQEACDAVAHFVRREASRYNGHWELCPMITSYSQALDTLWLKLPWLNLNINHFTRASA